MHNDETIWQCINYGHCSFKVKWKEPKQNFCRNPHNNTGLCNRTSCPLANSQYATVMEEEGVLFLYMKTVERAHSPKNLWERVKLSRNYLQALEQIDTELEYWPKHVINRCKQRLTKMRQMLIRMRKLSLKNGPRLVPIKTKTEKRERARELRAEAAAKVDLAIERELLERLKQGTYGDIYNFPKKEFESVIEGAKEAESEDEEEDEEEPEFVADMDSEDEEEREGEAQREMLGEMDDSWEAAMQDLQDMEDAAEGLRPDKKKMRPAPVRPRVELEYEEETEAR